MLRNRLLVIAKEGIPHLRDLIEGKTAWSQARLQAYRMVLAKVLPDLSSSSVEFSDVSKPIPSMSRAELEAALAATEAAEPVAIPDRDQNS